jgi:NAD(P)-dependent dehydrogenase (short-subunit alcohol dehydrogenase family)
MALQQPRVILVTGSSSGFGQVTSQALARRGMLDVATFGGYAGHRGGVSAARSR